MREHNFTIFCQLPWNFLVSSSSFLPYKKKNWTKLFNIGWLAAIFWCLHAFTNHHTCFIFYLQSRNKLQVRVCHHRWHFSPLMHINNKLDRELNRSFETYTTMDGAKRDWTRRGKTMAEKSQWWISKRRREWERRQKKMKEKSQRLVSKIQACSASCRQWTQQRLSSDSCLVQLIESIVFYILWLVESVVIVAGLCFFFFRYGFRLWYQSWWFLVIFIVFWSFSVFTLETRNPKVISRSSCSFFKFVVFATDLYVNEWINNVIADYWRMILELEYYRALLSSIIYTQLSFSSTDLMHGLSYWTWT